MSRVEIEDKVFEIARRLHEQGPGFAQEGVVMQTVREEIHPRSLEDEQMILSCWHHLFQEGKLAWGYNLDNPTAPWFHFPKA